MKIRSGFVSNSSSSSFVAVGFDKYTKYPEVNPKFEEAVKALTGKALSDLDYGDLDNIWYGNGACKKDGVWLYTNDCCPFFVGMDIEDGIQENKTLSELKKECKKLFKEVCGITVSVKELKFRLDECSSG